VPELVSVIIPVHNGVRHVEQGVRSAVSHNRVGPADDLEFLCRLAQRGERVELLPQVPGHTRVHPRATSARRSFPTQDALRFLIAMCTVRRLRRQRSRQP